MRDDSLRLRDILEAIAQIEKYTSGGRARFDGDELVRVGFSIIWRRLGKRAAACPPIFATLTRTRSGTMR